MDTRVSGKLVIYLTLYMSVKSDFVTFEFEFTADQNRAELMWIFHAFCTVNLNVFTVSLSFSEVSILYDVTLIFRYVRHKCVCILAHYCFGFGL